MPGNIKRQGRCCSSLPSWPHTADLWKIQGPGAPTAAGLPAHPPPPVVYGQAQTHACVTNKSHCKRRPVVYSKACFPIPSLQT
eukprot:1050246-Pelagomonas_calceolata.AAC.3